MERLSIFDIYKIGVGPSSSHTIGPWKAGNRFAVSLQRISFDKIEVHLYGSLSKTGKGHATDFAVQLGLAGHDPEFIDTTKIDDYIALIDSEKELTVNKIKIGFNPAKDIVFHNEADPGHPNTMTFKAFFGGQQVSVQTYYSVGGGFIVEAGEDMDAKEQVVLPYPISTGAELLAHTESTGLSISEVVYQNELIFRPADKIKVEMAKTFNTMTECVFKGCTTGGILPGGLNVKRRAKALFADLSDNADCTNVDHWIEAVKKSSHEFNTINKWISCFALAVNEENADLGRIVTSPTNGAAGVIPAVLFYYYFFCENSQISAIDRFLLTSGEIGCMFKKGATISAAVGGCQAEIGVSSAMAAGGLTEVLGGTPEQVLMAAEIAMEHHLGLTCDPIGGLVQIPCIERNAMGAMKAITASNLALVSDPKDAKVDFDIVVKTMWDTAQEMSTKYKETSDGGLAYNLPVVFPDC